MPDARDVEKFIYLFIPALISCILVGRGTHLKIDVRPQRGQCLHKQLRASKCPIIPDVSQYHSFKCDSS